MQQCRITTALVYVFLIALLTSHGSISSRVTPDMEKFINTSEPMWSFMTTSQNKRYDCGVVIIDDIRGIDVSFRRFHGYRKAIISDWMQFLSGRLGYSNTAGNRNRPYDVLNVNFRGGVPLDKETLLYQGKDNECGVVAVDNPQKGNGQTTYELRVKNSSIEAANVTDCFSEYETTLKAKRTTAQVTYVSSCQDLLIGMNNIIYTGGSDNGGVGYSNIEYSERLMINIMVPLLSTVRLAAVPMPTWLA